MDGHREIDDTALDREIESLLAVEPSPEFVARVRTRVAQEAAPASWRLSWLFAAAAAVAVVIVALIAWPSRQETEVTGVTRSTEAPQRIAEAPRSMTSPLPPVPQPSIQRPRALASVVAPIVERVRRIDIDLPEVLVADNEVKTFASLVARIQEHRFDLTIPAASDPDTPLEIKELPPLELLEIEPIVRVAALQPEGERP